MPVPSKFRALIRKQTRLAQALVASLLFFVVLPVASAAADTPASLGTVAADSAETAGVAVQLRLGAQAAAAAMPLGAPALSDGPERLVVEAPLAAPTTVAPTTAPPTTLAPTTAPPVTAPPTTAPPAAPVAVVPEGVWDRLAQCESSGNWAINTGSYDGGLQFLPSTWTAHGGGEFAPFAFQASRDQQIAVAERLLAATGGSYRASWPACSRRLGLP